MERNEWKSGEAGRTLDANQWMALVRAGLEGLMASGCDIGQLEAYIEKQLKELGRPLLEEAVQKLADRQVLICPQCGDPLHVESHGRMRHVFSVFGKLPFRRSYGFCPRCRERFYPADRALGLQDRAPASPRVQELCALMVLESPAGQAEQNIRRLTGLDLGQASMHREARRQGERALKLREADVALTQTLAGVSELASRSKAPKGDFTLVKDIRTSLQKMTDKQQQSLDREIGYFEGHKDRMDYKQAKALDQPMGSGAIESTCAQYQCRFKRTGQFWSLEGDEAFLALATLHRNGRWHRLFPHDQQKK